MELPESNNVNECNDNEDQKKTTKEERNQETYIARNEVNDTYIINKDEPDGGECGDQFSDDEVFTMPARRADALVTFRNAAFTWGKRSDMLLEVDDLEIPAGESRIIKCTFPYNFT